MRRYWLWCCKLLSYLIVGCIYQYDFCCHLDIDAFTGWSVIDAPAGLLGLIVTARFQYTPLIKYWIQFINNQSYRVTSPYFFHLARFCSIEWMIRPLFYHPYFHYDTLCILFSISVIIFFALSSLNYLNGHSWYDWLHLHPDWPLIRRCRWLKCRCSICLIVYLMKLHRAETLYCTLNKSRSVRLFHYCVIEVM